MGKKVSIYDLYKKEKTIKISDSNGNYVDILVRKLSQAEREEAIDIFNKKVTEEKTKLEKDILAIKNIKASLEIFNKEQLIEGIVEIEKTARNAVADLLPIDNEENISKDERIKKQQEEFDKWYKVRLKELEKEDKRSLVSILSQLRISSLATISASMLHDYACISFMCYNPETKERIFENYMDVGKVFDKKIVEDLIKEINEYRIIKEDKDIRELAEGTDFLSNGESEKSSADSHTTTKKK